MSRSASCFLVCTSLLFVILSGCERNKNFTIKTERVQLKSLDEILLLGDTLVKPMLYTNVFGLEHLPIREAKHKFISAVLPAILVAKHEMQRVRHKIDRLCEKKDWDEQDSTFYREAKRRYKAKNLQDLASRLETLPNSIILAQAAVESGWGQSRFFRKASNLFGVWSYKVGEPRIAAGRTRKNKTIYVRAYPDMSQSIVDYFEILARSRSYRGLRQARLQTNDPFELLPHLRYYSERRGSYTNQLRKVIMQNDLTRYDHYQIDPQYLVEEE